MKLQCPYSSLYYNTGFFADLKSPNLQPHPIFNIPVEVLLNRADRWSLGSLHEHERRLLFIALLKATDSVIFTVPAIPSETTIQRNMEALHKVVLWKAHLGDRIQLPGYHVTRDTYKLTNIGVWIDRWNEERTSWERYGRGPSDWDKMKTLYDKERALERLILSPYYDLARYQKRLGRLAMELSNAPTSKRDTWIDYFNLREDQQIFATPILELKEFLEFLEHHLDAGTLVGNAVFKVLRDIMRKKEGGLEFALDMDLEDDEDAATSRGFTLADYEELKANPYILLREDSEAASQKANNVVPITRYTLALENSNERRGHPETPAVALIPDFPQTPPTIDQFQDIPGGPSAKFQRMRAEAKWRLAKSLMEKQEEQQKKAEDAKRALDISLIEAQTVQSDLSFSSDEDVEKLQEKFMKAKGSKE